jgi:peroxiredoxin
MSTYEELPEGLAIPHDDGATDHLGGVRLPGIALPDTSGDRRNLSIVNGLLVIYMYPMTGRPGVALPRGWDDIPGARGCTPEACGFRDHLEDLRGAGVHDLVGISSQSFDEQREARDRLNLPFHLLSDADFAWGDALGLPSFAAEGRRFHSRLTLVAQDGVIEHVFYPVFPPDTHAGEVLAWLQSRGG